MKLLSHANGTTRLRGSTPAGMSHFGVFLLQPKRESEDCAPITVSVGLVSSKRKRKRDTETQKKDEEK